MTDCGVSSPSSYCHGSALQAVRSVSEKEISPYKKQSWGTTKVLFEVIVEGMRVMGPMAAEEGRGEGKNSSKINLFLGSEADILQNHEPGPVREGWSPQGMDTFGWVMPKRQVPSRLGFDA